MATNQNNTTANENLPSITGYIKDPANRSMVIIVVVGLLLLICTAIFAVNRIQNTDNPPSPTPITIPTTSPTPEITGVPEEAVDECFSDCSDEDFLVRLGEELEKLRYVKQSAIYRSAGDATCYGLYIESTTSRQYRGSFVPQECGIDQTYVQQSKEFRIDDKVYIYNLDSGSWDTGTGSKITRVKIFETFDLLRTQQDITSEIENTTVGQFRKFVGTSEKVNEFNRVIDVEVRVSFNPNFEITSYEVYEDGNLIEQGTYFGYNVPIVIEEPEV